MLQCFNPADGSLVLSRSMATPAQIESTLSTAQASKAQWASKTLEERTLVVSAFVDQIAGQSGQLSAELTEQMGRPISHTPYEIKGFSKRAHAMIGLAPQALAPVIPSEVAGITRFIRREPVGLVLVLCPWNYPWLCAVNAVVPALLAGNVVVVKHSDQTPLVAERLSEAFAAVGGPNGVLQHVHMTHEMTAKVVADPRVNHVSFTGSVAGGAAVHRAAGGLFKGVGLELGGKDPAYVRHDADVAFAADNLAEGFLFNAGQSCCAIERIFVHDAVFDDFVSAMSAAVYRWKMGDPMDIATTLGPVVRASAAAHIRGHVTEALNKGARECIDHSRFDAPDLENFVRPSVLTHVTPDMKIMREETFGPVVGVMRVHSDVEAVRLMNDSEYGLTASVWTKDDACAMALGTQLETGTVFQNRCDFLDPELAWVGVKNSGRGASLSVVGFESLTRPKSFHLRRSN
jgi:acyl-CoA reductase-like NAD-dependent aldehyde dehydrogenase